MPYQMHTIKVLLIEDNAAMMALTKSLLDSFGVKNILPAQNGQKALELLKEHNPDMVITDWMMKPEDGISITDKIRNGEDSPNPFVPIIMMTGFSEAARVIKARDRGVTEFLVKPFNARDLYRRIVQIIEKPRQFVRSDNFFGPDRRRKISKNFTGQDRRKGGEIKSKEEVYI